MCENVGFNMTPMIDIVFQLIVFLMLATDIAQTDIARVQLPLASEAVDDKEPPKNRLMVNVVHEMPQGEDCPQLRYERGGVIKQLCQIPEHWKLKVKNKVMTKGELEKELRAFADTDREGGPGTQTPSNLPVMIRADAAAQYEYITQIMEAAGRALMWKIEIGATKPAQ